MATKTCLLHYGIEKRVVRRRGGVPRPHLMGCLHLLKASITKFLSQSSQQLPVVPCWEQDFNLGTLVRTWKVQTATFYPWLPKAYAYLTTQHAFSLSRVPTSWPLSTTQCLNSKFSSALAKLSFQPLWKKKSLKKFLASEIQWLRLDISIPEGRNKEVPRESGSNARPFKTPQGKRGLLSLCVPR